MERNSVNIDIEINNELLKKAIKYEEMIEKQDEVNITKNRESDIQEIRKNMIEIRKGRIDTID